MNNVVGETFSCKLNDEHIQRIFRGCPLIGCANHRGIINGGFYEVLDFAKEKIVLKDIETLEETTIPVEFSTFFRLGWAITYHASQGRSLRESTRLHDLDHKWFSAVHLSLGISRVVSADLLQIS